MKSIILALIICLPAACSSPNNSADAGVDLGAEDAGGDTGSDAADPVDIEPDLPSWEECERITDETACYAAGCTYFHSVVYYGAADPSAPAGERCALNPMPSTACLVVWPGGQSDSAWVYYRTNPDGTQEVMITPDLFNEGSLRGGWTACEIPDDNPACECQQPG